MGYVRIFNQRTRNLMQLLSQLAKFYNETMMVSRGILEKLPVPSVLDRNSHTDLSTSFNSDMPEPSH